MHWLEKFINPYHAAILGLYDHTSSHHQWVRSLLSASDCADKVQQDLWIDSSSLSKFFLCNLQKCQHKNYDLFSEAKAAECCDISTTHVKHCANSFFVLTWWSFTTMTTPENSSTKDENSFTETSDTYQIKVVWAACTRQWSEVTTKVSGQKCCIIKKHKDEIKNTSRSTFSVQPFWLSRRRAANLWTGLLSHTHSILCSLHIKASRFPDLLVSVTMNFSFSCLKRLFIILATATLISQL